MHAGIVSIYTPHTCSMVTSLSTTTFASSTVVILNACAMKRMVYACSLFKYTVEARGKFVYLILCMTSFINWNACPNNVYSMNIVCVVSAKG